MGNSTNKEVKEEEKSRNDSQVTLDDKEEDTKDEVKTAAPEEEDKPEQETKKNLANAGKSLLVKGFSTDTSVDAVTAKVSKISIQDRDSKSGYTIRKAAPKKMETRKHKDRLMVQSAEAHQREQAPLNYTSKQWTPEQDEALRVAVEENDGKNWRVIAESIPGRTHVQCLQRWKKVLQPGLVKGHWTPEEDEQLSKLVMASPDANGTTSWVAIAQHIPGRTAKQCRERWCLNLDPKIKKGPWTAEEDDILLSLHDKLGSRWAEIAKQMDGRTENAVKTRFKSLVRAQQKQWTSYEDSVILESKERGPSRWAMIAAKLPGRSKNAVRNRWKVLNSEASTLPSSPTMMHSAGSDRDLKVQFDLKPVVHHHGASTYGWEAPVAADMRYSARNYGSEEPAYQGGSEYYFDHTTDQILADLMMAGNEATEPHSAHSYTSSEEKRPVYIAQQQHPTDGYYAQNQLFNQQLHGNNAAAPTQLYSNKHINAGVEHYRRFNSLEGEFSSMHSMNSLNNIFVEDPYSRVDVHHAPAPAWHEDLNAV